MYIDKDTLKVRSEKYYSVGYNSKIGKYLLADIIAWVAWYERYFEISKEEYEMFGTEELDAIAEVLHKEGTKSPRFLFSVKNEENTAVQLEMRNRAK
ncbi:MAG: ABC transporter ATP-binding protein [Firmicutes bacterium]|nr:ABC transporter ATP-binding protein [Bacillota bacterium]